MVRMMLSDIGGYLYENASAFAGVTIEMKFAAEQRDAIPHAAQANMLDALGGFRAVQGWRLEAYSMIDHFEEQIIPPAPQLHIDHFGPGMAITVGKRFLQHTINRDLHRQ